jgi:hypothetical protein
MARHDMERNLIRLGDLDQVDEDRGAASSGGGGGCGLTRQLHKYGERCGNVKQYVTRM